jgi:hypothetical protein
MENQATLSDKGSSNEKTYKLGMNQFADLSRVEFKNLFLREVEIKNG